MQLFEDAIDYANGLVDQAESYANGAMDFVVKAIPFVQDPDGQLAALQAEAHDAYERVNGLPPGTIRARGLGHNDAVDAFRHAYVSAKLAADFGRVPAWIAGMVNEARHPGPWGERDMDAQNNAAGRNIGMEAARQGQQQKIADMVRQAQRAKELIDDINDARIRPPGPFAATGIGDPTKYYSKPSNSTTHPFWLPDPEVDPTTGAPLKPIEWWQRRPPELTPEMRRLYGL
jgi:hypothetical protein